MKEKEMRSEGSRRQVQKKGGIILRSLRTGGLEMRGRCNEMDQKKEKNNTSGMAEEDSCTLPRKRADVKERMRCGSSTSTLISL